MSSPNESKYIAPKPIPGEDSAPFWEGISRHELVFQRCSDCGHWIHPPRPTCPKCRSLEKDWVPCAGKGTVYASVTYQNAPHPGFEAPYSVILVELEEGMRLVSNMMDTPPKDIYIGIPVEVVFDDITEDLTLPRFRKVE
ncbi:Zn-ribbon domain-containing OB-fold protein [Chloroflexota bacterium]